MVTAVALGGLYVADQTLNYATFTRDIWTLYAGAVLSIDYKLNFRPGNADRIEALHKRASELILKTCIKNGGLFIKFGQQIASLNNILPPQYAQTFKVLYDEAPYVEYPQVERIFKEEFHKLPHEIFATFEEVPVASASIAQVHKATLKDGSPVAVKIQKPNIRHQMYWDLQTYKLLVFLFEKLFDIPMYWSADYIISQVRKEADFINERQNAELAASNISAEPRLRDRVYIPKVYHEYSSGRVMTAEWIEGVKFGDVEALKSKGFNINEAMTAMVDTFAHQIFVLGFVHCDPHQGNLMIRRNPITKKQELVLLDHGLYIHEEESFRHNYALFWKCLFTGDLSTMERIAQTWGISDVQMLASSTLQRPWKPGQAVYADPTTSMKDIYEMQVQAKARVKHFMKEIELLPKEIIFIGRNMNLVRSNNKALGSPVNRVNIMADWAVRGLGSSWDLWTRNLPLSNNTTTQAAQSKVTCFVMSRINYYLFRSTLFVASTAFYLQRLWQMIRKAVLGDPGKGFEELMDVQLRHALEAQFGIVIDPSAFDA
ncbi:hypothetical protein SeLEV6574_g01020 [Synchytrium endobioticum]|uniref:ABC1 atypical kinase-like domain-containing protein n=2 Tax=Synchytrium endobioticum TaxID=286115 RepID=A0A507DF51_9FUNG|nr:hypothetical protein SeLEV6574_g01020 [Synchytrium endobioticum]